MWVVCYRHCYTSAIDGGISTEVSIQNMAMRRFPNSISFANIPQKGLVKFLPFLIERLKLFRMHVMQPQCCHMLFVARQEDQVVRQWMPP